MQGDETLTRNFPDDARRPTGITRRNSLHRRQPQELCSSPIPRHSHPLSSKQRRLDSGSQGLSQDLEFLSLSSPGWIKPIGRCFFKVAICDLEDCNSAKAVLMASSCARVDSLISF